MIPRDNAHDLPPLAVDTNIGTERIHDINRLGLGQLPRARGKGIRFGREGADRTQIDNVALQIGIEGPAKIACNLRIFTAPRLPHLCISSHFGGKPHTAGAGDTSRHAGFNQRTQIQIIDRPFWLTIATEINTVCHRLILQVALSTLIAYRTVKRVIDQEEFHHPFPRLAHHGAIGADHRRFIFRTRAQILDLHRT